MVDLRTFTPTRHRIRRSISQTVAPDSPPGPKASPKVSENEAMAPSGQQSPSTPQTQPTQNQQNQQNQNPSQSPPPHSRRVPVGSRHDSSGEAPLPDSPGDAMYPPPIRDHEEHIAALRLELTATEARFKRELEWLRIGEAEAASYWQSRHDGLLKELARADDNVQFLHAQLEAREHIIMAERDELDAARAEVRALRGQVRGLKEWISTNTRADSQTSDEVLGESVGRLADGLQNWVIINFRRARLDVGGAPPEVLQELGQLVPTYKDISSKLHLFQAIVARILDGVFGAYFFGLSSEMAAKLREMEQSMLQTTSPEAVNRWRATTVSIWRDEGAHLEKETDSMADELVARINRTLGALTTTSTADSAPAPASRDTQALHVLISSAIDVARQLRCQRAILRTHSPYNQPFDPTSMEDIGGDDDDTLQRTVVCVVFPAVIKNGDEKGAQLHLENVVVKARVLCRSLEE